MFFQVNRLLFIRDTRRKGWSEFPSTRTHPRASTSAPLPPFSVCVFTNTHTWFLQRDENEITRNSFDPRGDGRGGTKKILVMAPCCCCDPEKQSYLSAPEAAQLSARVSGKKKKRKERQMSPRPPAQPLAGNGVGGGGGLNTGGDVCRVSSDLLRQPFTLAPPTDQIM